MKLVVPFPSVSGIEGRGNGVKYKDLYYYYGESEIPKDKPAILKWEGSVHGDKEWIIIAWDGQKFVFLEHVYSDVNGMMKKYKGLFAIDAIKKRQEEQRMIVI